MENAAAPCSAGIGEAGLFIFAWVNRAWADLVANWQGGDMKRLEVLVPGAWWWGAVYDRTAMVIHSRKDLESLLARAQREGRDCYSNSSRRAFIRSVPPPAEEIRIVEDPAQFVRIASFPGLDEPGNAHVLWKWRGGPPPVNSPGGTGEVR